jgi:putative oxidoreductase
MTSIETGAGGSATTAAIARIAMGLAFMIFGLTKLINIAGTTAFIRANGMPLPGATFWLAFVIEVGLGLALVVGWRVRPVAAFLALYCLFIGFVFHFHPSVQPQRDQFLKNVVMAGGLLYIVAFGPGAWALGRRRPQ